MTRGEVESKVIAALRELQVQSGRQEAVDATPDTRPIGDLPEFDSLNGEEVTVLLEVELGCVLPGNIFIAEGGRRALSVREAVGELCQRLGVSEEEGGQT